jgi:phosphoadenosine phosphosulfate reductase
MQYALPFHQFSNQELASQMSIHELVDRAIDLLQAHEPPEGYYLAFSGGKDSCVIKFLAQLAGVKFEAWYSNTTIDPPELVYFIKREHPDVEWSQPKYGNMMHRVATAPKVPPTRSCRWCCEEYKEHRGNGQEKIFGIRAAESRTRENNWVEVGTDKYNNTAICPILYWTDKQLWKFIYHYKIPYCGLYDEGFNRLGCVGCPLSSSQNKEFARWPNFERNWKRAIIVNWTKWKGIPTKTGKPRYHAKFETGEDFWQWWRHYKVPDYIRGNCQMELLWTNEPG